MPPFMKIKPWNILQEAIAYHSKNKAKQIWHQSYHSKVSTKRENKTQKNF
jgi:hypothetical protein